MILIGFNEDEFFFYIIKAKENYLLLLYKLDVEKDLDLIIIKQN